MKPFELWTNDDSLNAQKQGWDLFETEGVLMIQRDDEVATLPGDSEAFSYVVRRASIGDPWALKALTLEGTSACQEMASYQNVLWGSEAFTNARRHLVIRAALSYSLANLDEINELFADQLGTVTKEELSELLQ